MRMKKAAAMVLIFLWLAVFSYADETNLHLKAVFQQKGCALCMQTSNIVLSSSDGLFCVVSVGGNQRLYQNFFFINIETSEVKDFYDAEYTSADNIVYRGQEDGDYVFEEVTDNFREKTRYVKKVIRYNWQTDTHSITPVEEKKKLPDRVQNGKPGKYTVTKGEQALNNFLPSYIEPNGLDDSKFFTIKCNGFVIPYALYCDPNLLGRASKTPHYLVSEKEKYVTISANIMQDDVFRTVQRLINPSVNTSAREPKDRLDQVYLVYEAESTEQPYEDAVVFTINNGNDLSPYDKTFKPENIRNRGVVTTRFNASFMDMNKEKSSIWGTAIYIREGTALRSNPLTKASVVKVISLEPEKITVPEWKYEPRGEEREDYIYKDYEEIEGVKYDYGIITDIKKPEGDGGEDKSWYKVADSEGDEGWIEGTADWLRRDGKKGTPGMYPKGTVAGDERINDTGVSSSKQNLTCAAPDHLNRRARAD